MIEQYGLQLQALESVFEEEKRRQIALMKKKQQQRQVKQEKQNALKAKVEEQEIDQIKNQLGATFGTDFFKEGENTAAHGNGIEEDDELLIRLKEWRDKRAHYK